MTFALASAILAAVVGVGAMIVGVAADVTGSARLAIATAAGASLLVVLMVIRFVALG